MRIISDLSNIYVRTNRSGKCQGHPRFPLNYVEINLINQLTNPNCAFYPYYDRIKQSRKNPVSASAMLTGKFLQIQKVFATSSLLAEEYPDTLQYKISR